MVASAMPAVACFERILCYGGARFRNDVQTASLTSGPRRCHSLFGRFRGHSLVFPALSLASQAACTWPIPGFEVALESPWGGLGVACESLLYGLYMAMYTSVHHAYTIRTESVKIGTLSVHHRNTTCVQYPYTIRTPYQQALRWL